MKKATSYVHVDLDRIYNRLYEIEKSPKSLYMDARISESTWTRIKRSSSASYHVAVTLAYVLGIKPEEMIIGKVSNSNEDPR